MTDATSKGKTRTRRKKTTQHHEDVGETRPVAEGSHATQLEEQIRQVGDLYRMITGSEPVIPEKPIAPIPPEVNPESYVRENLARLRGRLQGFVTRDYVTASAVELRRADAAAPPVTPIVNIWETDDAWICECDIPGADSKEVSLSIEDGHLHVFAPRHPKRIKENWRGIYAEMSPSRYERWIPLPSRLDGDSATAHHENGQLFIEIPKTEQSAERNVKVKVG